MPRPGSLIIAVLLIKPVFTHIILLSTSAFRSNCLIKMKSIYSLLIFSSFIFWPVHYPAQKANTPPPLQPPPPELNRPDDDLIRIETNLVSVPVIVSDRSGRFISGLKKEDFELFHDGVFQQIDYFADEKEPINIALLLDTSVSTREVIEEIKSAALDFIKHLKKRDRAMIIGFDTEIRALSPLTSKRQILKKAIYQARAAEGIGTVMRRTVEDVISRKFSDVEGRKAIILLTDGKDFGSAISKQNLFRQLEESDVLVYSVFYTTEITGGLFSDPPKGVQRGRRNRQYIELLRRNNLEATQFLNQMADLTAGRFYKIEVTDLKKTFKNIVEELRRQYRLGFYPPKTARKGRPHRLKVKVVRPNLSVRARKTYRLRF